MNAKPTVLVLENHRHTLPVVRSLGRAGYRVVVGARSGRRDDRFAALSRHVAEVWTHPDFGASLGEDFLAALKRRLAKSPIDAIFPVGEDSLRLLARARARGDLPTRTVPVLPPSGLIERCLDKSEAERWAREAGLPLASALVARDLASLQDSARKSGFPCAVKPLTSERGLVAPGEPGLSRKCVFADSEAELSRLFPHWPEGQDALLVQRRAPGFRHNCVFFASRGKVTRYFESKVLRTDAPEGTGYGVELVSVSPSSRRRSHCENAAKALGYDGIGCVQFMVAPDDSGEIFLELNPRLDATSALPLACGYDFPLWAVENALGNPPAGSEPGYPSGTRYAWTLGDFMGSDRAGRGALAHAWRALSNSMQADVHATFDWKDPRPGLFLLALAFASFAIKASGIRSLLRRP